MKMLVFVNYLNSIFLRQWNCMLFQVTHDRDKRLMFNSLVEQILLHNNYIKPNLYVLCNILATLTQHSPKNYAHMHMYTL